MIRRLETVAEAAANRGVRLMVDAEQTYFQPAIDHLVLHLQRRFNTKVPIIYNTYQCYLKDSYSRICIDLERSRREGFLFAAKIVRGAYMVGERARAMEKKAQDPVWPSIKHTHENYHRVVDKLLQNMDRAEIMVATHNEESVRWVVQKMAEYQTPTNRVAFGQLLGMKDSVSFSLGNLGYSVYKYVPYGPVRMVLPYLVRRAQENGDVLGGGARERRLLQNEILRRWKSRLSLASLRSR